MARPKLTRPKGARDRDVRLITRGTSAAVMVVAGGLWCLGAPGPALPERHDEVDLAVSGLSCGVWCPIQLDHALADVPGVHRTFVDVARGRVQVAYDPTRLDAGALARRVDALAGYACEPPLGVRAVATWSGARWTASVAPAGSRSTLTLTGPSARREPVRVAVRLEPRDDTPRLEATWDATSPELRLQLDTTHALRGAIWLTLSRPEAEVVLTVPLLADQPRGPG